MTTPGTIAVCTIASKNYLDRARVLATSFRRYHPDIPVYLLLVDRLDGCFDPTAEPFTLVSLDELPVPDLSNLCFRYSCQELNTAVKPFFLQYLFEKQGLTKVLYFDPDIKFYGDVMPLFEALDTASFVFTPHLTAPLTDDCKPSEQEIMLTGTFNLGFFGIANTPTAGRMLPWWQERLARFCIFSAATGLFVDQKWMELVPSIFGDARIMRDPGYNVAYWNLQHRHLECRDGHYFVNGEPLRFYHFSGFNADAKETVSKHQNRYKLHDVPCLPELFEDYEADVMAHGHREVGAWPYAFAAFDDGTPIPPIVREIYRGLDPHQGRFGDPFTTGAGSFYAWLNEAVDGSRTAEPVITRLSYEIYKRRSDVQESFPEITGAHRRAFALWMANEGPWRFKLPRPFLEALRLGAAGIDVPILDEDEQRRAQGRRSRLVGAVARLGIGKIARKLLGPGLKNRLRDTLLWGKHAQERLPTPTLRVAAPRMHAGPFGANVIGYLRSESGVGESSRAMIRSLQAAGVPVAGISTDIYCGHRKQARVSVDLLDDNPYPFNIFCLGAAETPRILPRLGSEFRSAKYNIGYWFWELEEFPQEWLGAFEFLQEIWVASSFTQECISRVSRLPVVRMPLAIEEKAAVALPRDVLDVPSDTFVVFFMFDYHSFPDRKNPLATLRAFQQAFPADANVHLVLKGTDSTLNPAYHARLKAEARPAQVTLIDRYLDPEVIGALLQRCNCYISLHRSEGFGLTMAEAMYLGKPVIATGYSANLDFMRPDNSYLVPYRLIEIDQDYGPYRKGWRWADADVEAAVKLLRRVYEQPDEVAQKGAAAARTMRDDFSAEVVGEKIRNRLRLLRGNDEP